MIGSIDKLSKADYEKTLNAESIKIDLASNGCN